MQCYNISAMMRNGPAEESPQIDAGITEIHYNHSNIRIYDKERMLIELMRFRFKIPMDYYKEIINNYRKLSINLDFGLVEDYAGMFKSGVKFMNMIQMEVL